MIARILLQNAVLSVSFASSHLLSLLAVGKITALVLDIGHLESVSYHHSSQFSTHSSRSSRYSPLVCYSSTPRSTTRRCPFNSPSPSSPAISGTYLPPPTSLSAVANIPAPSRSSRVPREILTDTVIEEIKTCCCFVGETLSSGTGGTSNDNTRGPTPGAGDESSGMDQPPPSDTTQSESADRASRAQFMCPHKGRHQVDYFESKGADCGSFCGEGKFKFGESFEGIGVDVYKTFDSDGSADEGHPPGFLAAGTGRGTLL
ncbi:hypothetical protein BDN72DRAFT_893351 [Pluteus cervinus]|uniref:Uncharacterized protein n=1 Tax=Pluteus cervinus TaxID=181527 RepID=A0ACD3B7Q6_9AGAR|nr:hypothetical protein BDN72DRAFT_893351 [Pluteus cervinus]